MITYKVIKFIAQVLSVLLFLLALALLVNQIRLAGSIPLTSSDRSLAVLALIASIALLLFVYKPDDNSNR